MKTAKLGHVLSQQRDILLVLVFALVLLMMVLPLPSLLMDIMITLNISIAVIILLMAMQTETALQFSTFPTILLVTTLFRLSISISTTRLILLKGDAGRVIQTFGEVVVGGNLVVGLVIFLIITVVQFLVITKGADRVAEVGARFTLDGMPGKQMSVDADVRAGNMDHQDATIARRNLEQEAKLFGAMDGAMKFVKGDAIAGLIITAINLFGGILIGMMQRGMSFGEAGHVYSLLTVGDGLVAQIPALMISVAAGTMVTRVTSSGGLNLGFEIVQQLIANGRTIIIAGVLISLFGFIPGFPTTIFCSVGLGMIGGVVVTGRRRRRSMVLMVHDWRARIDFLKEEARQLARKGTRTDIVSVILPNTFCSQNVNEFCVIFDGIRDRTAEDYGVPAGFWRFDVNWGDSNEYRILIRGEEVARAEYRTDCLFVKAHSSYLDAIGIPCLATYGLREGVLVSTEYADKLSEFGIASWNAMDLFLMHLRRAAAEHLEVFADFQGTFRILNDMSTEHSALVADLREAMQNNHVSRILQMLLRERIPISSRVKIMEAILKWSERAQDPGFLLQKVRNDLSEFITRRYASDGLLQVVVVAPTIESLLREGIRSTNEGNFLVLEPQLSSHVAAQTRRLIGEEYQRGRHPVLLTQQDIRFPLHTLLFEQGVYIPVLAYSELLPATVIYPVGVITADAPEE
ncbi:flagellar biosynthesis protein FlhA [Martelella sp. HB161492]|uniref:flagellar biosynthesis protein FlhA n=1 Tax=Martelella sp. HB161492 TaxID=2720726 RepID=UPI0015922FC1|nr:flagellar biosynthesis protein FlhA [Martelella sp. HB161492]